MSTFCLVTVFPCRPLEVREVPKLLWGDDALVGDVDLVPAGAQEGLLCDCPESYFDDGSAAWSEWGAPPRGPGQATLGEGGILSGPSKKDTPACAPTQVGAYFEGFGIFSLWV